MAAAASFLRLGPAQSGTESEEPPAAGRRATASDRVGRRRRASRSVPRVAQSQANLSQATLGLLSALASPYNAALFNFSLFMDMLDMVIIILLILIHI